MVVSLAQPLKCVPCPAVSRPHKTLDHKRLECRALTKDVHLELAYKGSIIYCVISRGWKLQILREWDWFCTKKFNNISVDTVPKK